IILFVYAAVSKLTDFENFQVQVAQSPLLSAFATFIAYATVIGELVIALMLCFKKSRLLGLYLFLGMMTAFTVYIYLILNYSPFVPCSCGGILEKMGWTEHLWFNAIISTVAAGIILYNINKSKILYTIGTIVASSAVVVLLFMTSEHIMKRENPFVRRFMPHPITEVKGIELPYNSYYIAGYNKGKLYLGNFTAPLHGLIINYPQLLTDTLELKMDDIHTYDFSAIKWHILTDTVLLNDYTLGTFYRGNQKDRLHREQTRYVPEYSLAVPMSQTRYALRTFNSKKNNVQLSIFDIAKDSVWSTDGNLDEDHQPKDLFSNDGMLLYNSELEKILYVFYYKNKTYVFDRNLENKQVLKSIDTVSTPNFKVEYLVKQQQLKMSEKALKVHKMAATSGAYLYIASDRIGKNESAVNYNTSTIIDVYRITDQTYQYSFYFYHYNNTPITQFQIYDDYIIGIGKNILSYARLKKH
ncbi:MAG: DoxX family protein, partial [Myroides sp.]